MPINPENGFYATGRRKEATARVWLKAGTGAVTVNGRDINNYFGRETSKMVLFQPLEILEQKGKIDLTVNVKGGGLSGQAGAIRHGIARALLKVDPDANRLPLRQAGLLTRDPRMKERKKYGLKRARKAPQYTKR